MWRSKIALSSRFTSGGCPPAASDCVVDISVGLIGVGIPVVQGFTGGDAPEFPVRMRKSAGIQELVHGGVIRVGHGLNLSVGAERPNLPPNVDHRFVQRVAQAIRSVTANHDSAGLR